MEWFFLLVPIIGAGIAKVRYDRRLTWWELCLPFFACIVAIGIGKAAANHYATADTEYHGGYLTQGGYYEAWDERVSCRHPKYCTRTVSDGKGRSHTESYQCGYYHAYDVDYHPEYWEVIDSNGANWRKSKDFFEVLCAEWKNRVFVNMHRSYHSINGDKYQTDWHDDYATLHCTVVEKSFENRVAVGNTVFNLRDVPADEVKQYTLFSYPRTDYFCTSVLGYEHPGNVDLDKTNALIGRVKQIRIWLLVFHDQSLQAAHSQEAYWKRGKKNELVACTSVDKENKIQWGHVFSWTDREDLKITTRQWFEDRKDKVLDVKEFNTFVKPQVEKNWERKQFKDFNYIDVQPPMWAYFIIFLVVCGTTVGTLAYGVNNEYRA